MEIIKLIAIQSPLIIASLIFVVAAMLKVGKEKGSRLILSGSIIWCIIILVNPIIYSVIMPMVTKNLANSGNIQNISLVIGLVTSILLAGAIILISIGTFARSSFISVTNKVDRTEQKSSECDGRQISEKKNVPLRFLISAILSLILIVLVFWIVGIRNTETGMGGMGRGLAIAFMFCCSLIIPFLLSFIGFFCGLVVLSKDYTVGKLIATIVNILIAISFIVFIVMVYAQA